MRKKQFYSSVKKSFVTSCNYIVTKFPLQDDVLKHARVANPANQVHMTYSSVDYFVNRFQLDGIDKDALELEFASYQVDTFDEVILDGRVDMVWSLSQLRSTDLFILFFQKRDAMILD